MESDQMESEMAERRARFSSERWVDFGSDMSAVEDFNKLLDVLMAVRGARLVMKRWGDFSLSEKKRIVSAVDDWINSLDDLRAVRRARLVMNRWVDFGSDLSAVEDFNKLLDDLRAVRRARLVMNRRGDFSVSEKKRIVSAVNDWINSLDDQMAEETAQLCMEIQGFFGSDVSAVEDFNKVLNDLRATGRPESPDSDVSFKSDQSKAGLIDFKDRVSPSRPDFSSSEKKHVVSDDGFFESPDDQEEMNQELSSELGWKHGHRQQLLLMVSSYYHAC